MNSKAGPTGSTRRTAIAVGALILTATVSYLAGSALIDSALDATGSDPNATQVRVGVFLEFVNAAAVVGVGVLLFPILRRYREGMALGYAATRIIESALLLTSALFALLLVADGSELRTFGEFATEGRDLAFQLAMIALGLGSLLLCFILYEARLVPRALPLLGFVGYVALFASGWLEIGGRDAAVLYIPGGLFELIFPLWLIAKGFNEPTAAAPRQAQEQAESAASAHIAG